MRRREFLKKAGVGLAASVLWGPALVRAQAGPVIRVAGDSTAVGEGGWTISGGQRQRLAIARALVRDPRLVVLDEANAALDPATEAQVQTALDRLCAGRTVLAVSHRTSALAAADRVIVMDGGRIAAAGPYAAVRHLIHDDDNPGAAA